MPSRPTELSARFSRVDGLPALMIAETKEKGYASQQPEFILRRPKVIVTE